MQKLYKKAQKWDICPKKAGHLSGHFWDIGGQAWDKNGTGFGHDFGKSGIFIKKGSKVGHLSKKHGTFVQKKRDICPPEIEIEIEKEIETEIEFIFLLGAINCSQFILQAECFSLLSTDNSIRYLPTIYERMYQ